MPLGLKMFIQRIDWWILQLLHRLINFRACCHLRLQLLNNCFTNWKCTAVFCNFQTNILLFLSSQFAFVQDKYPIVFVNSMTLTISLLDETKALGIGYIYKIKGAQKKGTHQNIHKNLQNCWKVLQFCKLKFS